MILFKNRFQPGRHRSPVGCDDKHWNNLVSPGSSQVVPSLRHCRSDRSFDTPPNTDILDWKRCEPAQRKILKVEWWVEVAKWGGFYKGRWSGRVKLVFQFFFNGVGLWSVYKETPWKVRCSPDEIKWHLQPSGDLFKLNELKPRNHTLVSMIRVTRTMIYITLWIMNKKIYFLYTEVHYLCKDGTHFESYYFIGPSVATKTGPTLNLYIHS